MTKIAKIHTTEGWKEVPLKKEGKHLFVHGAFYGTGYIISHKASGRFLASFPRMKTAIACMEEMDALPDWEAAPYVPYNSKLLEIKGRFI